MDIPTLSMALSQSNVMQDVSMAMLSKSLDTFEDMGEGLTKIMDQSVSPELGNTIDITV